MRNRPLCSVCLLWIFLIAGIVWFGGEKAEDFFSPSDLETCVEDREEVLVSGTVWKKRIYRKPADLLSYKCIDTYSWAFAQRIQNYFIQKNKQ